MYSYTIASGNKQYKPSQYSGDFTVNGEPVSISPTFAIVTFSVTFSETGLPSGTPWSIVLNGTSMSSASLITFSEPNGTYTYSVHLPSGYTGTSLSGSFKLTGQHVTINIAVHPATNYKLITIVALIVIVAVIAAIVVMMRRGQR